jgi:hypothetical protein
MKTSSRPWYPPPSEKADIAAIKALATGTANSEQQIRAVKWIVEVGAMYYDLSYSPGDEGRRDTDFAEGRRFVGAQIVKMTKIDLSKIKEVNSDKHEPKE